MAICYCFARNLVQVKFYIILYSRGSQPVVRVTLMVCGNASFFEKDQLKIIRWYAKTLFDHLVIRGWEKVGNHCSILFCFLGRLFNSLTIWLCFYKPLFYLFKLLLTILFNCNQKYKLNNFTHKFLY
jgi:hypothetical protein